MQFKMQNSKFKIGGIGGNMCNRHRLGYYTYITYNT